MGSSESCQNKKEENDGEEVTTQNREEVSNVAVAAAAVAVAAVGVVGLLSYALGSDSGKKRKTMKAPGRDHRIYRDDFDDDPAQYFRSLRK